LKIDVMGVAFDNVTMDEAVASGAALLNGPAGQYVVTPNSEIVYACRDTEGLTEVLNRASLVLPDGIGVVYASKILGRPLKQKVAGIDFAAGLAGELAKAGKSLFLLGAKPGIAEQAAEKLKEANPGLVIAGVHDGYFKEDGPVVEEIARSGADAVFVCLGAPKQEFWMAHNGAATGAKVLVGLGGSLDVFAGVSERAPEIWVKLGLEWLYRLVKEPWRFKRMSRLPKFLFWTIGAKLSGKA
jgi:N-acetylglucosaminyldiphosphoundecaprenol N-acetyl-beta-D-mannosaminyltransferase